MNRCKALIVTATIALTFGMVDSSLALSIRQASGPDAAAIQSAVAAFRDDLGNPLNLNLPATFAIGHRQITWDDVPDNFAAPNFISFPVPFDDAGSTGLSVSIPFAVIPILQVSAAPMNATGTPVEFGNINSTYPDSFTVFSSPRLFAPLNGNEVSGRFLVPGVPTTLATVSGFGAVFTDVDLPGTTSIQFFPLGSEVSLGTFFVPPANNGLSFLGVSGFSEGIQGFKITLGNARLGLALNDANGNPVDVVALDNFIYGEPRPISEIPEPSSLLSIVTGLAALSWTMIPSLFQV